MHPDLNELAGLGVLHAKESSLQAVFDEVVLEADVGERELEPNILERIKHILQLGESAGAIIQCLQGFVR